LRNCAQAHAIALADQVKACSKVQSVVFMQRSEMKKILGKFKMHFLQISVYFFMVFVKTLRFVVSFFVKEKRK
jgi:hypothetical protein